MHEKLYPWAAITAEFDGAYFTQIYNPPEITLWSGAAGFDPETGKTIFYGFGRELDPEKLETFEYDGATWKLVETEQRPLTENAAISGLVFIEQLHGLIGVPSNYQSFQTWRYRDEKWEKIEVESTSPARHDGVLSHDISRDATIYWGGLYIINNEAFYSFDTLELKEGIHCRPLTMP